MAVVELKVNLFTVRQKSGLGREVVVINYCFGRYLKSFFLSCSLIVIIKMILIIIIIIVIIIIIIIIIVIIIIIIIIIRDEAKGEMVNMKDRGVWGHTYLERLNMPCDAIWCVLRHNFEKCCSVCTDLVASDDFSGIVTYIL